MSRIICIGSRESRLAVIQTRQVADYIRRTMPEADCAVATPMKTTGDPDFGPVFGGRGGQRDCL